MEKFLGISMTPKQLKLALTVSLALNAAFILRELGIFDIFAAFGITAKEEATTTTVAA